MPENFVLHSVSGANTAKSLEMISGLTLELPLLKSTDMERAMASLTAPSP